MLMEKEKICKGCKHYTFQEYIVCKVPATINGVNCPCSICLVKTMCTDTCTAFFSYRDSTIAKNENCRGCNSVLNKECIYEIKEPCPCHECLVKPVCGDGCDAFLYLLEKIDSHIAVTEDIFPEERNK